MISQIPINKVNYYTISQTKKIKEYVFFKNLLHYCIYTNTVHFMIFILKYLKFYKIY
jgi:hypothetical protein